MLSLLAVATATALAFEAPFDPQDNPGPWENQQLELTLAGGETLSVHALVAGPEDGPVVVLLHGFPDFSYGWRGVLPELARDHRVIAPDLRGYAGTQRPEGPYDMDTLVGDVEALLDQVSPAAPVHLMAHDWGAAIAWRAVADSPKRYASLSILSVPHPAALDGLWWESKQQRKYGRFAKQMQKGFMPGVMAKLAPEKKREAFYEAELVNNDALTDQDFARYALVFDERAETDAALAYYREALTLPRRGQPPAAQTVTVPTLVLWGAEDSYMLPSLAASSCGSVTARCESEVFDGVGHWLHWEKAPEVAQRWRAFQYGESMAPAQPEAATDFIGEWSLTDFDGAPASEQMSSTTWSFTAEGGFTWTGPDDTYTGTWEPADAGELNGLMLTLTGEPGPARCVWEVDADHLVVKLDDKGRGEFPANLSVDPDFDLYGFTRR